MCIRDRGNGEQGKMEKTGCKIICGAPTTLTVKGLMKMMMMMMMILNILDLDPPLEKEITVRGTFSRSDSSA